MKKSHASLGVTFILLVIILVAVAIILWVNISQDTKLGNDFLASVTGFLLKLRVALNSLSLKFGMK